MPQPELLVDCQCHIGEDSLRHPLERCLYWTDIPHGNLFRYFPARQQSEQCLSGEPVGGFTIQADGALLLFMACGAVAVWNGGNLRSVVEEIPNESERDASTKSSPIRPGASFAGLCPRRQHIPSGSGRLDPSDFGWRRNPEWNGIHTGSAPVYFTE